MCFFLCLPQPALLARELAKGPLQVTSFPAAPKALPASQQLLQALQSALARGEQEPGELLGGRAGGRRAGSAPWLRCGLVFRSGYRFLPQM